MRIIKVVVFSIYAFIILISQGSFAEQIYCYKQGQKIKAVVSKDHLNRIWFSGKAIIEVIGDSTKYKILQDASSMNLFVTPLAAIGEDIEMAVIEAGGRTIDLSLRVSDSSGQLIFIEEKKDCYSKSTDKGEIARLMRYMHSGKVDKYIVNINKRQIHTLESQGLKIRQDFSYRYGPYVGAKLTIANMRWYPLSRQIF
ncbi:type-F conjugative transfer system secretin TraK [Rickettsia endosymbiont of Polydrusus tereticollis]|uniref:TraK domain-containing protein n=1 Tax=Rickettsia endosymbiont of Polydrusus tereticollis TaxID=3066251 RepID=UPI003132C65C